MYLDDVINEARGFLNALRLQCKSGTTMWINSFPMLADFEATVEWYINEIRDDFTCTAKRDIKYNELLPYIKKYVFNKMAVSIEESVKKNLEWHFIEYYGLASTIDNKENPFNPLVSQTSVLIRLTSTEYEISACYITPVGKHIVVTTLGRVT